MSFQVPPVYIWLWVRRGWYANGWSLLDFVIPDAEFEALNKLDKNERYNYPFRWGIDVFGELGATEAERRAEEHAAKLRETS